MSLMYRLVNLKRDHLLRILASSINSDMRRYFTEEVIASVCRIPYSVAVIYKGDVVAVGGVNHHWEGRASIWAMFSDSSKHCFLPVFRATKKWLNMLPYKRLEMDVPCGNKKMIKRANLWGFEVETERARSFNILGYDCTLLARVRD